MTAKSERPHVDAQHLTGAGAHIYEAVATLEQAGHPPTREEIAAASGLDDGTVGQTLAELAERGVVVADGDGLTLASHEWSSAPQVSWPRTPVPGTLGD